MKLCMTVWLAVLLAVCCAVPCMALPETHSADVSAVYTEALPVIRIPVPDGTDRLTAELPGGIAVITGAFPPDAETLVIFPIPRSETEAYAWFSAITGTVGADPHPYEIYFLNQKGEKRLPDGVSVTLPTPPDAVRPMILSADCGGTVTPLPQSGDTGMTFVTDGSDYYIAVDALPPVPPTGDGSGSRLLPVMLLAAATALALRRRSRRTDC